MNNSENKKGFTLIELLVVIAILAVLAVAVTLVLNPAQLVRQGRDSTRMSDIAAVHRAIGLYFADQQELDFDAGVRCTAGGTAPDNSSTDCSSAPQLNATTTVDGTGWVGVGDDDIQFNQMSTGAPLSRLPLDPVNDTTNFYVFISDTSENYELNAAMESTRYTNSGGDDVESTDGGDNDDWYEVGNASELNL